MRKPAPYVFFVMVGLLYPLAGCPDLILNRGGILNCQADPNDPFQGRWKERSSISCEDGSETEGRIQEIIFCQNRFAVTWTPFETFIDYWGDYVLDPETNELTMTVTGGNFIPDDTDLVGTVEFQDDGSIILRDMYLGTNDDGNLPADGEASPGVACGHILELR